MKEVAGEPALSRMRALWRAIDWPPARCAPRTHATAAEAADASLVTNSTLVYDRHRRPQTSRTLVIRQPGWPERPIPQVTLGLALSAASELTLIFPRRWA